MKLKIIAFVIIFLACSLSILLFIEDTPFTRIIVSPKIYSIVKSSETESFGITVLANDTDSYFFNKEYIANIFISSLEDEIIPLEIVDIDRSEDFYILENQKYYYVTFNLIIGFDSDDYLIEIEDAFMNIDYRNSKELKVFVGEFNYLFNEELNTDFSLNNLFATHLEIGGVDTVSGLFLNLGNLSENNIVISNITIGSNDILANNFYLTEVYDNISIGDNPKDIINNEDYNFFVYSDYFLNRILLRKSNEIELYVPLSYVGDIRYLYRFYIQVEYLIDSEEKILVIDDFPFINTSCYKEELEEGYFYYEYEN